MRSRPGRSLRRRRGWKHRFDVPVRIPAWQEGTPRPAASAGGWAGVRRGEARISPFCSFVTLEGRAKSSTSRRHGRPSLRVPDHAAQLARRASMTAPAPRPRHISVFGREVLAWLDPREGGVYVDATFGAGGYSEAVLETREARVIGIDRDRTAIAGGFDLVERSEGRLTLVEDRFSNLADVCSSQGVTSVDGVVMDIGVSSMQLDQAARGFSFRAEGPLDMRMGQDGPTAADVIAKASEADLANIIYIFGEERHSRAVARAIVAARKEAPITSTRALADLVAKVVPGTPGEIHPATRTFQGLRIFVNGELDELQ